MKPFRKHAVAAALAFAAVAVGSAPAFAQGPYHVYARQHHQVQPRARANQAYDYVAPSAADPAPAFTTPAIGGWKDLH
jgi:hypothetical protein